MKLVAIAGELAGALALAASLTEKTKTIPALEAVHIKAADSAVRITANSLDHLLALDVPATVESAGEVAVSGGRLTALTAAFPANTTVEIETDGTPARVSCGQGRFKLPTVPLDDLPAALALDQETGRVELVREATLLVRPAFATSTETARFYMGGILLRDNGDALTAAATDGHRLVRTRVLGATGLSSDFKLIVPNAAIKIVNKLLADKRVERVTLRRSQTLFALETANAAFVSKLIDGPFPNYTKLIPTPSGNSVTVDGAELAQALARAAAVAADKRQRIVGLAWDSEPVLRLCLADTDTADDVIPAETTGTGRVAVAINILAEHLDALEGKHVCIDSRSGGDPVIVVDPDDEVFFSLVMPCRCGWVRAAQAA